MPFTTGHFFKFKINFLPKVSTGLFNIIDQTDSTNNYAMRMVHEGMAMHGKAWFTRFQTNGKGQRGKIWESLPGENILMSVIISPPATFSAHLFHFNALIALTCAQFIEETYCRKIFVKWPNDLYVNDRKAGGILIENSIQGSHWKWSVVGLGININGRQTENFRKPAISMLQATEIFKSSEQLAQKLHQRIVDIFKPENLPTHDDILRLYNEKLYKKDEVVKLKHGETVFEATIRSVDAAGNLITENNRIQHWRFGELEWLL